MQIHLISIGTRLPRWVEEGYLDYAKRLPGDYRLNLIEIPAQKRGKGAHIPKLLEKEAAALQAAIPSSSHTIALDRLGKHVNTHEIAQKMLSVHDQSRDIALLIGGPEGLTEDCLAAADERWSLSALTLPHPLVRVVIAEQIYRAWSILSNHPYHR